MKASNCLETQGPTEDQNFTFTSLTAEEKKFPSCVQTPTIDHQLGRSLAALLSFEAGPDEPTDDDIDPRLAFHLR